MTTKYKIILGFGFMVLLIMSLAFLSDNALENVAANSADLNRRAVINVMTSDAEAAMLNASAKIFHFLDTRDPQDMADTLKLLGQAEKLLAEAKVLTKAQATKEKFIAVEKVLPNLRRLAESLGPTELAAYNQYADAVLPAIEEMTKSLAALADMAAKVDNVHALSDISTIWRYFAAGRAALGRFSESRTMSYAETARDNFKHVMAAVQKLQEVLRTDAGRRHFESMVQAFAKLDKGVAAMQSQYGSVVKTLRDLEDTLKTILKLTEECSQYMNARMDLASKAMASAIDGSQKQMLFGSIAGVLLGLAFACFIIYGIMRMLRETGGFAAAVAQGDFSHAIALKEGGEIGAMIANLRQIPKVLEHIIKEAAMLANDIQCGHFQKRLDTAAFSGSFSDLAKAVNTVSDAYSNALNGLGVPVMCCDKNNNIVYLSAAAQQIMGGNLLGRACAGELKSDHCEAGKCFGLRAMSQNAVVSGETTLHPCGQTIEAKMVAVPLYNTKHEAVGFMEIMTDLTAIKAQQATMLRVARDAGEIASRVAAASEELAAQVEQISRGAEVQRERVESTASAMTEMNSTVLEVARSAGQASDQSENTRLKADEGATLVNKVVRSINDVNAVALSLQNNMTELGQQAESIGGVMNVISDIADQTNLLALNAAIEAARAGEAGRGFAVVADEVRKLAEKTMQATHEVGSNIQAIQTSAQTNISSVSNAVKNIGQATDLANASGQALNEIVTLAGANSSVVASIAAAAEEQSATSEEISRAIEEINKVVAETSEGMLQSSAAVQDLSQQAQQLHKIMGTLK